MRSAQLFIGLASLYLQLRTTHFVADGIEENNFESSPRDRRTQKRGVFYLNSRRRETRGLNTQRKRRPNIDKSLPSTSSARISRRRKSLLQSSIKTQPRKGTIAPLKFEKNGHYGFVFRMPNLQFPQTTHFCSSNPKQ